MQSVASKHKPFNRSLQAIRRLFLACGKPGGMGGGEGLGGEEVSSYRERKTSTSALTHGSHRQIQPVGHGRDLRGTNFCRSHPLCPCLSPSLQQFFPSHYIPFCSFPLRQARPYSYDFIPTSLLIETYPTSLCPYPFLRLVLSLCASTFTRAV
jgi:hypothetical protein